MLATMIPELQTQHEDMKAHEMIVALRQLYQGQSRHERFLVSKALFSCKLSSGNPVGPHVLKMIGYITNLEKLGVSLQKELATDLILQSLPELYKGFVMNYMMHDLDKPLPELLKMLHTAEENLTKGKGASVLMVQGGKGKPKKGIKIKARTVGKPKSKSTSSATQKPIGGVAKGKCHHCGNDIPTLTTVKTWLSKSFSMKDLGDSSYALGIRIYRDRSRKLLGLSQSTFIDKVLARFSMSESKRGSLPMAQGTSLSKTQGASTPEEVERMRNVPYASAIGSIMTKDAFLVYGGKVELSIVAYTDASFQTDRDDFKSQAG
ncbi:unnamed protein product, partial [Cuscuta campestris]